MCLIRNLRETNVKARTDINIYVSLHKPAMCRLEIECSSRGKTKQQKGMSTKRRVGVVGCEDIPCYLCLSFRGVWV